MNNQKTGRCYRKHLLMALALIVCMCSQPVVAQGAKLESVTVKVKDELIQNVFSKISKQSSANFFYEEDVISEKQKVNLNFTDAPIQSVLDEITRQTSLSFKRENNTITVNRTKQVASVRKTENEPKRVTGKVTDETGETLFGVTVVIKGTTIGEGTDANGQYILNNVPEDAVLQFVLIGMKTVEVAVKGKSTIDVVLQENAIELTEFVAIGYGTVRKSDLTGALSSVSSKQFKEQNVTRVDEILQGRTSGVQITNAVGAPGGDVRIRIRGANSVKGDNSPLFVIDGFVGADFNMINPNDVESIEVLKDASSTAIYGSRGANGVILITTKAGRKDGKVVIDYQGSASFSTILKKYDMLNAMDFISVANEKNAAMGLSPQFTANDIEHYRENGGFDYQDAIYRTGFSTQHQISLAGGTQKTTYRISGNYLSQEGIVKRSKFERYTLRLNLQTKITDKLSFRFNMNGADMTGLNTHGRKGAGNPIVQAMAWAPTTNPYDKEGGYTLNDPVGSIKNNPLAWIYDSDNKFGRTFANIMGGVRYEIIEGLSADFQAGADISFRKRQTFSGDYLSNYQPSADVTDEKTKTIQTTSQLSYDKSIAKGHRINAVVAIETQKYDTEFLYGSASQLKFASLKYDNLALAASNTASSGYSNSALLSYIGRVNYSLHDKYLFTAAIRYDGSSKFAPDNRFSIFPSVAVGWNAGNESFVQNLNIFSKLKLRASWGETGSQAISPYSTLAEYNTNIYYAYETGGRTPGIQLGNPANKALKWETTEQKDLGVELGFFNGRLGFDFDYYIKNTRELLLDQGVPYYLGGGTMTSNVGKVRNNGWDFSVNGVIIDTKDLSWESNFNLSYVKNKVINLGDEERMFSNPQVNGLNGQPEFVYQLGQSLGSFWGLKYLGPWQADQAGEAAKYGQVVGDARYQDLDGSYTIDGSDYQIIGCGLPTTTLGWNNTVNYKNFTFNMFVQGVLGIDKQNYTRGMHLIGAGDARFPTLAEIKDRYIPGVNEGGYLPAFSKSSKIEPQSTMFLEDASYVRLKNLSVAYTITVKKVGNIKITASASNLFTITKYKGIDPESSNVGGGGSDLNQSVDYGSYPNSRTYTLGVGITF